MVAGSLSYRVFWSEEDSEYVGVCDEFPSLSHRDPDRDAALLGIKDLVDVVIESADWLVERVAVLSW